MIISLFRINVCCAILLVVALNGCRSSKTTDYKGRLRERDTIHTDEEDITGNEKLLKRNNEVETNCSDTGCDYYVRLKNNQLQFILNSSVPPAIESWNSILELVVSCGSPCNYTFFVNVENGEKTEGFYNVIAIDTIKQVLAYTGDNEVIVRKIFSENDSCLIQEDFSPVAELFSAVDSAYFVEDGLFIIRYLSGDDFVIMTDSVYCDLESH